VRLALTPSQTAGPFLALSLPWADGPYVVPEATPGAIAIAGTVRDGAGAPVADALLETWQAAPDGSFTHTGDPRGPRPSGFRGFGRCLTGPDGQFRVITLRPGVIPGPHGGIQAPHIDVSVFARGLLDRLVTRVYFPDEQAANETDPVLRSIADPARRATLIAAAPDGRPGEFRFDIKLQGERETVFFDV
jgi:protocatechuate 3,4-dioxygenase, alpha subunit